MLQRMGVVLLASLLLGGVFTAAPSASSNSAPADLPFRVVLPTLANDGHPLWINLSTEHVHQGGTIRVAASDGVSGTAVLFGRSYPLSPAADGLMGFVGIGVGDPIGPASMTLNVVRANGQAERQVRTFTILKTQWTVDYIFIPPSPPPDPNAPPPPPPPPDETALLPVVYSGFSPPKWQPTWAAPLGGPLWVTGYFGEQRSFNGGPVQGHHGGTDFGAPAGTPILSTNDGVVVMSGHYRIRGILVVVDHGGGVFSLYGHMQERTVTVGDMVKKGDVIGYVGSTGLSTGPHLHWEMSVSGVLVDGLRWLDGSQGF
jgi:hypothetical protein